jgi:hypothetical protein
MYNNKLKINRSKSLSDGDVNVDKGKGNYEVMNFMDGDVVHLIPHMF